MEPGGREGGFGNARAAEAERAGLAGCRGRQLGTATDDADRDGEEPIAVRGGIDDRGDVGRLVAAPGACWRALPAGPGSRSTPRGR